MRVLNLENLTTFERRVNAIHAGSIRCWGKLEPAAMLTHLDLAIQLSLGEIPEQDHSTFWLRNVIGPLAYRTPIPWPRGKIKVPDSFTPAANGTVDECRASLITSMRRFVEVSEREPKRTVRHPLFGPYTLRFWRHVHGKHCNHHFEQFGV